MVPLQNNEIYRIVRQHASIHAVKMLAVVSAESFGCPTHVNPRDRLPHSNTRKPIFSVSEPLENLDVMMLMLCVNSLEKDVEGNAI